MALEVMLLDTKDMKWEQAVLLADKVSQKRRERILRFRKDEDKLICTMTGFLIRKVISEKLGISFDKIDFEYNKYGKPHLKGFPDYHFSVSHSGNLIVFVESEKPVGIDTEKVTPMREGVMKRCFTENEKKYVKRDEDFFRIWTSKEAYVKMLGTGLSSSLKSFDVYDENIMKLLCHTVYENYMITVCGEFSDNKKIIIKAMKNPLL